VTTATRIQPVCGVSERTVQFAKCLKNQAQRISSRSVGIIHGNYEPGGREFESLQARQFAEK